LEDILFGKENAVRISLFPYLFVSRKDHSDKSAIVPPCDQNRKVNPVMRK
jgi:hypothetical protein